MTAPVGRVLVTGGAGFIGSHVVRRLLADGWSVTVLDDLSTGRPGSVPAGVALVVGSVVDRALVRECVADADCVVHLGAIASVQRCVDEWFASHVVNLSGTVAILEAVAARSGSGGVRHPIPVVYASSAAVYGGSPSVPSSVSDLPSPLSQYAADKLGCELHARAAAETLGVDSVGLRFFNVYGAGQDPSSPYSGVISRFASLMSAARGITVNGDGGQTRDFVSVVDVAAVVAAVAARLLVRDLPPAAHVHNVGTGVETSLLDLVGALSRALRVVPAIAFGPGRVGEVRRSVADCSTLAGYLGGAPSFSSLFDGLVAMRLGSPDQSWAGSADAAIRSS